MYQCDCVINKNITNIFTSLYYIYMYLLQSMLYMHIVTLYVLQITVLLHSQIHKWDHIQIYRNIKTYIYIDFCMLIMVSITHKIYRNVMYFLCIVNCLQYLYTYIHLWFIHDAWTALNTITPAYCNYSIHLTCC